MLMAGMESAANEEVEDDGESGLAAGGDLRPSMSTLVCGCLCALLLLCMWFASNMRNSSGIKAATVSGREVTSILSMYDTIEACYAGVLRDSGAVTADASITLGGQNCAACIFAVHCSLIFAHDGHEGKPKSGWLVLFSYVDQRLYLTLLFTQALVYFISKYAIMMAWRVLHWPARHRCVSQAVLAAAGSQRGVATKATKREKLPTLEWLLDDYEKKFPGLTYQPPGLCWLSWHLVTMHM